jgi:hypothetical protein
MGIYINIKCYILHIFMTMCFLVFQNQKEQTPLKSKKKKQIKKSKKRPKESTNQYTEYILFYDHGIDILN